MTEFITLPRQRAPFRLITTVKRIPAPAMFGLVLIIVPALVAILAPWIMPHDPSQIDPSRSLLPPFPFEGSEAAYLLGTDNLGRDMLSRLIEGSRISLLVGVLGVVLAGTIGLIAGLAAGYYGGATDAIIMRIVDALLAIPGILLVLVILGVVKPGVMTLVVVLGFTNWVIYARQIRAEVLEIRERLFVEAARNFGVPSVKIIARHIAPNVMPTFIVLSTLSVATIIITESSLSFLGLGVQPPNISWGLMLTAGRDYITSAWWLSTLPGVAITATVLGILLLGDWLRDALDPRLGA
ncbi:ABC transporter permease [Microbacterium sp. YY-03]|uniref:ABC transporter permease n=1 Tax=Microbacterium sp. YY-03 TaxID=3421636 RepID=UPI003D1625FB